MINNLIFLGGALALILATGQLIRPKNGNRNYLAASLLYCLGLIHLITFSQKEEYFFEQPVLVAMQIPLFTLLGPFFYLFFMRVLNPPFTATKKHLVHFIPTAITVLVLKPYLDLTPTEQQAIQLDYSSGKSALWETFPNNLVVIIFVSTLIYILLPLRTVIPLFKRNLLIGNPTILTALGFIVCFSITLLCVIFYQFYDIDILQEGVAVFYTCWIVSIYLVNQKYPSFLTTVTDNISYAKYKKSQLANIDTDYVLNQLQNLMLVQKVYLDENLTLPALADKLSLTTHQLSEILNHNLNTSFKNYIKKYRIEEAKRLLREEPSLTILTIAMDVGFKSASTFNSSFKKEVGVAPMDYRKSHS
ncbi:MAG: helix-turn-helix domain-containing protein [Kordiimonas sp.]